MPSPTRPIPLTVIGSEWIEPLEGEEGRLYLSRSIPIGESTTLDGSVKAKIRYLDRPIRDNNAIREKHAISLRATMPWLDRELPLFSFTRTIDIQYPLELTGPSILSTLAPGSRNKLTVKVGQYLFENPRCSLRMAGHKLLFGLSRGLSYPEISLAMLQTLRLCPSQNRRKDYLRKAQQTGA
jgi:hypothetical protein